MKVDARRVERFLAEPGNCRVVLLHGQDGGLVRERASALVRHIAGALDDPFRVVELEREGLSRLTLEMAARPMTGGRRVVRLRDATDAASGAVQAALALAGEGLLVMEAGELTSRSKLRLLVESAADGAAIACYAEQGADLLQTIVTMLGADEIQADPEALAFLVDHLGEDRGATRREIEKLVLYVGGGAQIALDDAAAIVGDVAGLQLDDALLAAIVGDVATADRALGLALGAGATPVAVLRAMLVMLQRLGRVKVAMSEGQSAVEAVRGLRPPVFFARQATLIKAAGLWSMRTVETCCAATWIAERNAKRTGAPAGTLCRHIVLQTALTVRASASSQESSSSALAHGVPR